MHWKSNWENSFGKLKNADLNDMSAEDLYHMCHDWCCDEAPVIAWESGWMGYISLAMATADDQTPHAKMFAGKADKGVFSILQDQKNWDGIAKAILATKQDINISHTGISSTSSTSAASEKAAITPGSTSSDNKTNP